MARAIHAESARRGAPFQALNCATLSPTLLESELFGHVRGAFTGAIRDRQGLFALARHGTLFLDEVADIPLDIQGKLLRVLEERSFFPVGSTRTVHVDVRLISATNRSLRRLVAEGKFREDLSYRIRVVPLQLPPLRDRREDVLVLLWTFAAALERRGRRRIEGLSRAAADAILSYDWPGNVRELRNVVEHALVVGTTPMIELADLTPELRGEPPPELRPLAARAPGERERILAALARYGGRRAAAAAAAELGMSRSTLWRKLAVHRIA